LHQRLAKPQTGWRAVVWRLRRWAASGPRSRREKLLPQIGCGHRVRHCNQPARGQFSRFQHYDRASALPRLWWRRGAEIGSAAAVTTSQRTPLCPSAPTGTHYGRNNHVAVMLMSTDLVKSFCRVVWLAGVRGVNGRVYPQVQPANDKDGSAQLLHGRIGGECPSAPARVTA
jgi:hypothetical protein